MALPAKQKTYSLSPCNRVVYASVVQVQREVMFGIKNHMKSVGYTVKGSSTGAAAAMDGVDRWAAATDAGTRGANTTTANSWICLTSALGVDIVFSFVGATDDIYRISISHQGDYVAAGTPTFTPTSSNEQVLVNTTTITTNTTGDRLWTCLARTDAKGFRVAIARQGVWVGSVFGSEEYTKTGYGVGITTSAEAGFGFTVANLTLSNFYSGVTAQSRGSYVRTSISPFLALCGMGGECFADTGTLTGSTGQSFAPELQGGVDYTLKRVSMFSSTTAMRGKVGNFIDLWVGRSSGIVDGDHYGNREFINLGNVVWPWDGTPSVPGSVITMS